MKWKLVNARNGFPTIEVNSGNQKYFLHSRYDPKKEAFRWLERLDIGHSIKKVYILGMGLGYHVREFITHYPSLKVEVWDFNNEFRTWIVKNEFINDLLVGNTIQYYSSENLQVINEKLFTKLRKRSTELLIHKPSLRILPNHLSFLKEKLDDINFIKQSFLDKKDLLLENFEKNINLNDQGVPQFGNKYSGKPFILVSAGPSLTKQLTLLKEIQANTETVIGCVGTALKPLLNNGISPNFIMISDPQDNIYKQIEGVDTRKLTLFYLSTANKKTVSAFKGKRYIVWQKGYSEAEEFAKLNDQPVVETGGSVATCLLDLMVKLGAKSVALVGQDLAFTDGKSHAESTTSVRAVDKETTIYEVDSYDLTYKIPTSKNLSIYRKWFEQYVKEKEADKNYFWNCTEGGAHIVGWNHKSLQTYYTFDRENKSGGKR